MNVRAFFLFLLLSSLAHAEHFHLWLAQPVITRGRQVGARCPFIPEALAMADQLRAAGHTVTVHNAIAEQAPGLSALPAFTVVYNGVHVPVVQGHRADRLQAAKATRAAVTAAKAEHDAARVAAVQAAASSLRVQAGEKSLLADKLRVRGSVAEADTLDAEADKLDAEATAKDTAAVEMKAAGPVDAGAVGP